MSAEDERAEIIERYRREIERLERSRDFGAVNRVRMALHRELREHEKRVRDEADYCQYKEPYTGAPAYVWYIDNEGREVKRPYEG